MKRNLFAILLCTGAMCTTNMSSNAQSILIHYWNFNSASFAMYTPTITAVPADYTRITSHSNGVLYTALAGTGTAGNVGSYFDTLTADLPGTTDYDTVNVQFGAPEGLVVRTRNPSDSMQLEFIMPTTNYTNLRLDYGTQTSSTGSGQTYQVFSYSKDGGATWITSGTGLSEWIDSAAVSFKRVTVAINDPAASDNSNFIFRITFSGNNHPASGKGNNRFDNITLHGDTLTNPGILGVNQLSAQSSYSLVPNPVTNNLTINSDLEGSKSLVISNTIGRTVYTGTAEGKGINVSTAELNPGMYILSIRDNTTGNVSVLRFVKQ
jgi:type IX secretion system substrate protein